MKKVKHWLHILLAVLTSGLWLLPYVVILACTEQHNRGYRAGKAAGRVEIASDPEWMRVSEFKASGKYSVEPGNTTVTVFANGPGGSGGGLPPFEGASARCGGGAVNYPSAEQQADIGAAIARGHSATAYGPKGVITDPERNIRNQSRLDRFAELADRNRQVGLDEYERAEYFQLRAELSR